MSMMVNGVSGVSFRANSAPVNAEELLSRPGSFSRPMEQAPAVNKEPKKHSFLKAAIGLVVTAAVVAGALYAAHKHAGKIFDAAKSFEDIAKIEGNVEKYKTYLTTAIGKAGKYIDEKAIEPLAGKCMELWDKIPFKKAQAPVVPE
jgi:hypothetical protein